MANLFEGMRTGDLEDMVLPLISVDEYKSKIDDSAIVVGFYVGEQEAANDLNRFIQRSPIEILDTEISPAPDQQGYFMVFVELLNNAQFGSNVSGLLDEVGSLTNIEQWKMHVRGVDDLMGFDKKELMDKIEKPEDAKIAKVEESILHLLTPSDLRDASVDDNQITLSGNRGSLEFEFVALGESDEVLERLNLNEQAVSFTMQDTARCDVIQGMLGEGWCVTRVNDHDLLLHVTTNRLLVLR